MSDEIEMRASEEMPPTDAPIAVGLLPRLTFRLLLKMRRRLEPLKRSPRSTLETTG